MPATPRREASSRTLAQHLRFIREVLARSEKDPEARQLAVKIVSGVFDYKRDPRSGEDVPMVRAWNKSFRAPPGPICKSRDDQCEIERVWDFMVLNFRYVYDPADEDTFQTLKVSLTSGGGDCFPEGTLLLRDDYTLVPVEDLKPGMRIWGRDRWSDVTNQWCKGIRPVTAVRMNNGSWMHLTEDHKVYVAVCPRHNNRAPETSPCSCPVTDREIVRLPVAELQPDMVLLQPREIEAADGDATPEALAWAELTGLYLSDGWCDGSRICIAGKDGHPKEAQKRRVIELGKILGFNTSWHERYVRVYGNELVERFAPLGRHAPNKSLSRLDWPKEQAVVLLAGIMADSGANTHGAGRTFTTTSRALAVQTRVLHRLQGVSCGWAHIENHGGLGTHPIWRLTTRPTDGARAEKLLRVKEIVRDIQEATVYDISTDDHYVYLPEHDVTVSNCDDAAIALAALLKQLGFYVIARVISTEDDPEVWAHIYPLVGLPKDNPTHWIALDLTVEGYIPGDEYPKIANHQDFKL
jgi:hypothetical protein